MKKWAAPILMIGAALFVLLFRAASPTLLIDSDTSVLLRTIREKNDPWLWFRGDWPLFNHFYRPLSTLAFEFDNHFYRDWAPGYGWTNAILAAMCVVLVGWLAIEITGKSWMGAASAWLFTLWLTRGAGYFAEFAGILGLVILVVGLIRDWKRPLTYLTAGLALWYLADELVGQQSLWSRTIAWLPGRTATTMTVCCLVSMIAYARWERYSSLARPAPEITPMTPPATRSTRISALKNAGNGWLVLAFGGLAFALGCYEQAVMLPACLMLIGLGFRVQKFPARRGWVPFHVACWALLGGYMLLRHQILPAEVSGYQKQQLRFGPGVWLAISSYLYPFSGQLVSLRSDLEMGPLMLVTWAPLNYLTAMLKPLSTAFVARKEWAIPAMTFLLSVVAFLPMAFLQHFDHYDFWPMALRSIFVISLLPLIGRAMVTAVSPRGESAPPRSNPAPGSLPRP